MDSVQLPFFVRTTTRWSFLRDDSDRAASDCHVTFSIYQTWPLKSRYLRVILSGGPKMAPPAHSHQPSLNDQIVFNFRGFFIKLKNKECWRLLLAYVPSLTINPRYAADRDLRWLHGGSSMFWSMFFVFQIEISKDAIHQKQTMANIFYVYNIAQDHKKVIVPGKRFQSLESNDQNIYL